MTLPNIAIGEKELRYLGAAAFFLIVCWMLPDPWGWRLALLLLLGFLAVNRDAVKSVADWLSRV